MLFEGGLYSGQMKGIPLSSCDLMLFEGGLYLRPLLRSRHVSCDLMLFEGGLYLPYQVDGHFVSCDLMLFEGGLYYWGCNSFSMRNIFDIFQSFFKKAPIEEVRAAAE